MDLTPNPIIVPMTVASNNQSVPMTVASNMQDVSLEPSAVVLPMPKKTSDLINDGEDGTSTYVESDELSDAAISGSYYDLRHKPSINGVELVGDKTFADLGLEIDETPTEDSENAASSGGVYDALEDKEDVANKVTSIDSASTDAEYPSAKAVYDLVGGEKPYLKCVGYWYLFSPSRNRATLEIVNGTSLDEVIKQPVQVYASMNDAAPDYMGQSLIQINQWEGEYIVVFPQSIQWAVFLTKIKCGGAKFRYQESTHQFTFQSLIDGTELKENKVQRIPEADADYDYASDQYPSIRAIRKMFDDLHTEMESEASATKTLVDLELDENGDLVPTFDDIAVNTPVQSVNGKTGAVILNASDVGALPNTTSIPTKTSDLTNDGADGTSTYVEADELASVATSGSYNDLADKPTIPAAQVNSDWDANSGVAQILNKPSIPSKTSDLTNDSDYTTDAEMDAELALKADSAGASANYAAKLTARIPYGECDSTSTSTAFTATVPGITELKDGVTMLLYNGVVTSASGFTININGLGAKPSYSNMALGNPITPTNPTRDTTIFNINYAFLFVYSETLVSGGCWIGYRGYDANTNTIGYQLRTNNSTMKASDKFYRYRLLFTSADGSKWVPANTSTSTNATSARTPNTRAIDPFGEIVWYGTTTAIEANANVTAAQLWQEYYGSYTNIGYSFNNTGAAQTMTANLPIYIKCTPQADGSAIIDPTTPYTQSLPNTDDGKIYIYLGRAYNETNFEITMNHPVYYHDGSGIRLWTGVKQMPAAPVVDGTYSLKCTVNNGVAIYSWVND